MKPWTQEEDDLMRALAATGISASKIAEQLTERNRCMVLGRCYRKRIALTFSNRSDQHIVNRVVKAKARYEKPARVPLMPGVRVSPYLKFTVPEQLRKPVTLLDIRQMQCRYPVGKGEDGITLFCASPVESGSYCPRCAKIVYMPRRAA